MVGRDRCARGEEQKVRRAFERFADLFLPHRAGADVAVVPTLDAVFLQPLDVRKNERCIVVRVTHEDIGRLGLDPGGFLQSALQRMSWGTRASVSAGS